ncbi:MAG: hypothetical protein AAB910_02875, partial [Patescibacteria group bacterium]
MDKSGFFSSLGAYLKANRKFFLVVLLILASTFGYFWYRSGFTLDVNKFFAVEGSCGRAGSPDCAPGGDGGARCQVDGVCASDENNISCPADCLTVVVTCNNDGVCDSGETIANCPADCPATPPVSQTCDKANIAHGVPSINVSGNPATAWVTNNNGVACTISLASYNVYSNQGGTPPHYIETQTLYQSTTVSVGAGQTANLSVGLPNCYSQVDLIIGEPIEPPNYSPGYFLGVQNWDVGDTDGTQHYCNEPASTPTPTPTQAPTPTPTLTTSPTATPSTTVTPQPLVCTPASQVVALGSPATMVGSGGTTRSYGWYAPGS